MPRYAIGLDVEPGAVRVARIEMRLGGRFRIDSFRVAGASDDEQTRAALQAALEERGWGGEPCMVAVRGETIVVRSVEVPETVRVADLLESQLAGFRDLAADKMIHAHCLVPGERGNESRLLLAVTRNAVGEEARDLADALGLELRALIPASLALHAIRGHIFHSSQSTNALLDVGRSISELVIWRGSTLLFARSVRLGLDEIDEPGALDRWLDKLSGFLELFRTRHPEDAQALSLVVLGDELGGIDGAIDRVRESLHVHAVTLSRLEHVHPALIGNGITATGLAYEALQTPMLSLLPLDLEKERREQSAARIERFTILLALVTIGVIAALLLYDIFDSRARLQADSQQLQQSQEAGRLIAEVREGNMHLHQRLRPQRLATYNRRATANLLQALAEAKDPQDWVLRLADRNAYQVLSPSTSLAASPTSGVGSNQVARLALQHFVIEGLTSDSDLATVRRMIDTLQTHPHIRSIDLIADDRLMADELRDRAMQKLSGTLFAVEVGLVAP